MNRLRIRLAARRGTRRFAILAALHGHSDGLTSNELQKATRHRVGKLFPDLGTLHAQGLVWAAWRMSPTGVVRRHYGLTERGRRVVETGEPS